MEIEISNTSAGKINKDASHYDVDHVGSFYVIVEIYSFGSIP